MIYSSINRKPNAPPNPGLAYELDLLKSELSKHMVDQKKVVNNAAGDPAGSRRIPRREAIKRMEEYEDPAAQDKLKELSDGELVDLTRESIRLRKEDNRYNLGGPDFKKLIPTEAMISEAAAPSAFMPPMPSGVASVQPEAAMPPEPSLGIPPTSDQPQLAPPI
jgi:hypothetical protein